jgi:hypothetical protein
MGDKFDLARMLREIGEEKATQSGKSRSLTQEEIKRMVAQRKKQATPQPEAGAKNP